MLRSAADQRRIGASTAAEAVCRSRRWAALSLLGLLSLASCGDGETSVPPQQRPQRIVLLTVDTLRFDGFTPELMPETCGLLGDGHVFSRCFSATSTTQPTHATILTGLHPWEHGVTRNGLILSSHFDTLQEVLQREGFWTSAVVTSYPLKGSFGYSQGFDDFDDEFAVDYSSTWVGEAVGDGGFYSLGETAARRARAAIGAAPEGPQFFWFHFFDPHDPYGDTPSGKDDVVVQLPALRYLADQGDPTFEAWLPRARAQYERDVTDLDRHLAGLIRAIRADETSDTTVILTADHGESFGQDMSLGHGDRVSEPQIHVPLAILLPERKAGTSVLREDVVGSGDLAHTIAHLAGLEGGPFQGRNLLAQGSGGSSASPDAGIAFGMRRLAQESKEEIRLDGSRHDQSQPLFYVHRGTSFVLGNSSKVWLAKDPKGGRPVPDEEKIMALFRAFEDSLEGAGAEELNSAAARKALGALGYGRK